MTLLVLILSMLTLVPVCATFAMDALIRNLTVKEQTRHDRAMRACPAAQTRLDKLVETYMQSDPFDPTQTIDFLHQVNELENPLGVYTKPRTPIPPPLPSPFSVPPPPPPSFSYEARAIDSRCGPDCICNRIKERHILAEWRQHHRTIHWTEKNKDLIPPPLPNLQRNSIQPCGPDCSCSPSQRANCLYYRIKQSEHDGSIDADSIIRIHSLDSKYPC